MKEWTKKELSRKLTFKDTRELKLLHDSLSQSIWRTQYHIQTVTGLMNDPNGFCNFNGKWHLFYQWFPFGAVHGMKHWYHVESEDLLHWKNLGLAMEPDNWYDNYGCYSGSALVEGDIVYFTYTGNNRDEKFKRNPYQLLAGMNKEGKILKYEEPLITPHEGYTEHQRDPKIFKRKEDDMYYILLGAQNMEGRGRLLLYRSKAIHDGWELLGEVKIKGYEDFGYMAECPDIERIGDKYLLLFSPQGLESDGERFNNKFNNIYFIGDLDFSTLEFTPDGKMEELDCGFDFYAAQCASQKVYENTAVLEGWFGVSDYTYPPTDEEGWAGLQTMARELTIKDGKLIQKPVYSAASLKKDLLFEAKKGNVITDRMHAEMPRACVMRIDNPKHESLCFNLFTWGRERGFEIAYDHDRCKLTIDRSMMHHIPNREFGLSRTITLKNGLSALDVFVDHSTIEIFVNDGEYVMSSRIFPEMSENMIRMAGRDIDVKVYTADRTVEDNFVL